MAKRRVVITGMGAVTPLGHSVEDLWRNILACKSGIGPTRVFDASTFPTQFSAEVKDYDLLSVLPEDVNPLQKQACRHSGFILGAAMQAWQQAGLPIPLPQHPTDHIPSAEQVGIYLGAGEASR